VNEAETRAELIDPALRLPDEFAALGGDRVLNRLRSLAPDRPRAGDADGVRFCRQWKATGTKPEQL
jgi:hypothetical protein